MESEAVERPQVEERIVESVVDVVALRFRRPWRLQCPCRRRRECMYTPLQVDQALRGPPVGAQANDGACLFQRTRLRKSVQLFRKPLQTAFIRQYHEVACGRKI